MRLWKCNKCGIVRAGIYKPKDFVDVKIYYKAQSKGGTSIGCNLCLYCAKKFFNSLKLKQKGGLNSSQD